jgi:hypothetical protein
MIVRRIDSHFGAAHLEAELCGRGSELVKAAATVRDVLQFERQHEISSEASHRRIVGRRTVRMAGRRSEFVEKGPSAESSAIAALRTVVRPDPSMRGRGRAVS